MRQKIVRLVLVGGVLVLAMLLLLATCGSGEKSTDKPEKHAKKKSPAEVTQLTVPSAYAPERGWELIGTSPDYAISRTTGRLAYLVRESETKYQLRTIDNKSGQAGFGTARAGGPRRRTSSRGSSRSPSTTTSTS